MRRLVKQVAFKCDEHFGLPVRALISQMSVNQRVFRLFKFNKQDHRQPRVLFLGLLCKLC